jgi:hypothetical protein
MLVFAIGAMSGAFCILAADVQKGYYRNARDLKKKLEADLELGEYALQTTTSMGWTRDRIARITTFQTSILVALVVADLSGLGVSIAHALRTKVQPVEVAARVVVTGSTPAQEIPLVFSHNGKIAAAVSTAPGALAVVQVAPGRYEVSALVGKVCASERTIGDAPLESVVLRCRTPSKPVRRRAARHRRRGQ